MSERRASALSPPEFYLLTTWGAALLDAFGAMPYLVGSCERGEPYRDVDVRMLLSGGDRDLLADEYGRCKALNVAMSVWGQRATGLPIDFQFQDQDAANEEFAGQPRNPIGIHGRERWPTSEPIVTRQENE